MILFQGKGAAVQSQHEHNEEEEKRKHPGGAKKNRTSRGNHFSSVRGSKSVQPNYSTNFRYNVSHVFTDSFGPSLYSLLSTVPNNNNHPPILKRWNSKRISLWFSVSAALLSLIFSPHLFSPQKHIDVHTHTHTQTHTHTGTHRFKSISMLNIYLCHAQIL